MTRHFCFGFGVLILFPSLGAAQPPAITHERVACAVAERFPKLEAQFVPAEAVAKARVVFQGAIASEWYSVDMKVEGSNFSGVLPKPQKSLKSFRYYIEVTDRALGTNRTEEYTAAVVDGATACRGRLMAGALASAAVILQGPAGVAALPAGFSSAGVVAGTAAGSSAAAGAGASVAGAGGGIGATALVLGGLAAAGGAVAVAAHGGDSSGDSGSSGSPDSGTPIALQIMFLPAPGMDVSVCGPGLSTFNGQGGSLNRDGTFSWTWSPATPNVMSASGTATPTSFQANIACTNGARSGTITASGSNYTMSGTFEFGPSRGQVSISRIN